MDIKKFPGIKKNVNLAPYTTFKIGGKAKYFLIAKTKEDLIKALTAAKKIKLPFIVLGEGSNILVADKGFEGLVAKCRISNFKCRNATVYTESGVLLGKIVNVALETTLTGLEWAVGIPGTVGGAIYGNTGAFNKAISDHVEEVEVFDLETEEIRIFKNRKCKFDYRESIFKKNKNLIILSAKLKLKKAKKIRIQNQMKAYLNHRKETQPLNFPSAGSIFKNFIPNRNEVSDAGPVMKKTLQKFGRKNLISVAELIEKCRLKGKKIGKAQISKKHANFIVNLDGASAEDVKKLIELTKQKVKNNFGVKLKEEICYFGF